MSVAIVSISADQASARTPRLPLPRASGSSAVGPCASIPPSVRMSRASPCGPGSPGGDTSSSGWRASRTPSQDAPDRVVPTPSSGGGWSPLGVAVA